MDSMLYRRGKNTHGGGILVYFRNNITSKLLKIENLPSDIEAIFIEMNIKSKKWLLCCTYNPNKSLIENHLRQLQKQLEAFSERYEHFLIMGDFNGDVSDPSMTPFCTLFKLKSIVKEPTCYKNPENPSCIDLFLTNCPRSFHNTCLYETGLSDFHKLVVTILRTSFEPLPPKIIKYRNYKNFDEDEFRFLFKKRLNDFNTDDITVDIFKMTFLNVLNKFAPLKKKYLRANNCRFVNKELNKAIMQRSRLRNAYLKDKTRAARIAYKKQRNVCVSILRKSKKYYDENLDAKNITNNKKLWGTMKPLFSNKVRSNIYISLNEGGKLIKNDYQIANIFNAFLLKLFQTLALNLIKDIYVTLATFLTQLKKLYKNIKIIQLSLS